MPAAHTIHRVAALVALTLAACSDAGSALVEGELSVVFISIDTLRADHLGSYGHPAAVTPEIDRLAAESTRFEVCISSAPMTFPSHATMMTGAYPFVHGARNNGSFLLSEDNVTLAEVLREAGYATHAEIGAAVLEAESGMVQGFDGYGDTFIDEQIAAGEVEPGLLVQRYAGAVTDAALRYLDSRRAVEQPFFLFVHYYDPHLPYQAPEPFASRWRNGYLAEIAYTDTEVGRLLEALGSEDFAPRTVLVLTSDHGDGLGEHREFSHGTFLYDSTLRVPLILRAPGRARGQVVRSHVGLVDIMPTLLELVGIAPPPDVQGTSLVPLLEDPGADLSLSTYSETFEPRLTFGYSELRALRSGEWKYIHGPRPELYEVARDPDEARDRAAADAPKLNSMRAAMRDLIAAAPALHGRGEARELDREDVRRLAALGYAAEAGPIDEGDASDPHFWRDELEHFEPSGTNPMDKARDIYLLYSAMANMEEGSYEPAIDFWNQYLERNPDDASGFSSLARCLALTGRETQAIDPLRRALALDDTRCDDLHMLGSLLAESGRPEDARDPYERALACDPGHPLAAFHLGKLLLLLDDPDAALVALDRALEQNAAFAKAHSLRARALQDLGRADEAVSALRLALELDPKDGSTRIELAACLHDTGHVDDALAVHEESLRILPRNVSIRAAAARFWMDRGEGARALELLEDGLRRRPDAVLLAALRVRVLATAADDALRDGARARQLAEQLLAGGHGEDPRVLGAAAAAAAEQGDFDAAVERAEEAIGRAQERDADALVERIGAELAGYRNKQPARMN